MQPISAYLYEVWTLLEAIIPVISPLLTVVLTGLLVYLYRQQSEIQDRQRELAESNQRSLLRVLTYRLFSWRTMYEYAKYNQNVSEIPEYPDRYATFIAYLSNPGKGFAEKMNMELQISTSSYDLSSTGPLVAKTNTDQLIFSAQENEGGVVAPEENETAIYTTAFWFSEADIPDEILESDVSYDEDLSPSEVLWLLEDVGECEVEIGLFLHYADGTGARQPIQLLTSKSQLRGYDEITEVWRNGGPPSGDMEPLFEISG